MGINALTVEDPEFRLIRVRRYSGEGLMPVVNSGCPYQAGQPLDTHPNLVCCVSGSGGSICCGYWGHIEVQGRTFVKCVFSPTPEP